MSVRKLHDGSDDGLVPLQSVSLDEIDSFAGLVEAMSHTAFGGRQLGLALDVVLEMIRNPKCKVVLTLSGAMTVAKQGRIICDMIDRGMVHAVVCTGALIAHGLTESIGLVHYRHNPKLSDEELFAKGYNRVYDTVEMEQNLNDVEKLVRSVLNENQPKDGVWSSARFCKAVGERLSQMDDGPGILRSAYEQNVPVFIPAFTDSEVGLDVANWAMIAAIEANIKAKGVDRGSLGAEDVFCTAPPFNPFLDLMEYARLAGQSPDLGIFTIGGGVPRNWAQQVAPFFDVACVRMKLPLKAPRFRYGVRICPEPSHWGGLSGCTYSEGVSWGKFVPPNEGGRYAEVAADATLVLPLLMKAVFEKVES